MKYYYKSVLLNKELELTKSQFEAMYIHITSWTWLSIEERDEELSTRFRVEPEEFDYV